MAMRTVPRLAIGLAVSFALLGAAASPAIAEEYTIHLHGHTEPLKASFYAEEPPWIFFRDDDSQYIFAVGCDRVQRVERGGAAIPPAPCPVERLPTTMPRVYLGIMDLEAKGSMTRSRDSGNRPVRTRRPSSEPLRQPASSEAIRAREPRRSWPGAGTSTPWLSFRIRSRTPCSTSACRRIAWGHSWKPPRTYPKSERQRFFFFGR